MIELLSVLELLSGIRLPSGIEFVSGIGLRARGRGRMFRRAAVLFAWLVGGVAVSVSAQSAPGSSVDAAPLGRLVLVLPFDNRSGNPALDWIGASFPDTLNQRLGSAGFLTISREDRAYALDHLGLPAGFRPSRATTIRIAQTMDADFVVVGSYTVEAKRLEVRAQVLRVSQLRLSPPLADSSDLQQLYDAENAIAWKVAREIDPQFSVAEGTFLSASAGVPLSAFENYIRGVDAGSQTERLHRLNAAVEETPSYTEAVLALGRAQFAARDYDKAATTLAKVPLNDRRALEARFFLGLARMNTAKYADAEQAFAFVANRLPLPEVVNNQAVAVSRQVRDAAALFQRAVAADPNDADYHFNVAVALLRRGDRTGAQREADAALKLRKGDSEAQQLRNAIARGEPVVPASGAGVSESGAGVSASGAAAAANGALPPSSDTGFAPLERLRRTYSEASFRQAAFQLDQMRQLRLATLKPAERATEYTQQGQQYLAQGLLPEAEQECQLAIASDPRNALARAELAQVREQSGSEAEARTEAEASLHLAPNVPAYLVLARLALKANQLPASAQSVSAALQLAPTDPASLAMRQTLVARGQPVP